MSTVLILGATSGIASALAKEFAAHKYDLVLGGRDRDELSALASDLSLRNSVRASVLAFDALDTQTHAAILTSFLTEAGNALAGAVVCIGYLGDQAKAQVDWDEARLILETNFTGCVSALNILANHFELRRTGFICALSSVAGDRGRQSNYLLWRREGGPKRLPSGVEEPVIPGGRQGDYGEAWVCGHAHDLRASGAVSVGLARKRRARHFQSHRQGEECGLLAVVLAPHHADCAVNPGNDLQKVEDVDALVDTVRSGRLT